MHWFTYRRRGRPPHPDVLTPAEWRVLEHVRRGRTNPEIAQALGLSLNTVKTHVSSMLVKLDLADRTSLAAWEGEPAVEVSRSKPLLSLPWIVRAAAGAGAIALAGVAIVALSSAAIRGEGTPGDGPPGGAPSVTEPRDGAGTDGLPAGAIGPLLVHMTQAGSTPTEERNWPAYEVGVYDAGARQEVERFALGEPGEFPADVALARREVLVNVEHAILAVALDGSRRVIYEYQADAHDRTLQRMHVSPDGRLVAFVERVLIAPDDGQLWRIGSEVIVLEVSSSTEVLRIPYDDPRLNDVQTELLLWGWAEGGSRLVAIDSGGSAIAALSIGLDGTVEYREAWLGRNTSPDGRLNVRAVDELRPEQFYGHGCLLYGTVMIEDFTSGERVASASVPGAAVWQMYEWSPDSAELLFPVRMLPQDTASGPEGCGPSSFWTQAPEWYLLDVQTSDVTPVDAGSVRARWAASTGYPDVLVECPAPDQRTQYVDGTGRHAFWCSEAGGQRRSGRLVVDGHVAVDAVLDRVLGWVDVP